MEQEINTLSPPECVERDLLKAFDSVNKQYFKGKICAGIGWRNIKVGKLGVNVGLCTPSERFIEINAILKDKRIPYWFLKCVIYHEILHILYGVGHSTEFVEHEKWHKDYFRYVKFFEEKLDPIISDWVKYQNSKKGRKNGRKRNKAQEQEGENIDYGGP